MQHVVRRCVLWAAVLLSGCSSFNLGTIAYCPHGQQCLIQAAPPVPVVIHPAAPGVNSGAIHSLPAADRGCMGRQ